MTTRAKATRQVYLFEDLFLRDPPRPIAELRALGQRIWRETTRRRDRCPRIIAGRGIPHCGKLFSYCDGRSLIVLSRTQRRRSVLIHELVHALGPETHKRRFQERYADLIGRYL